MTTMYRYFRFQLGTLRRLFRHRNIYQRFQDFTMIPRDTYSVNLSLAERVKFISGCVVECGVWRGGMTAGIASILGPDRKYFLFDSFEGLPPAKEIDGPAAIKWQQNTKSSNYYDNCAAPPEFAERAMRLAGISSYELVRGWFNTTVPTTKIEEPIALLRLDADWYDSTMICLEFFYKKVRPGGLIILDDYYAWDGCSRALHDFLSCYSAIERIHSIGNTCYLEKKPTR